ncbi:hypothetical protein ACFVYV_25365 [Streptomyces mirabilis]|uniref:hypothetical protein n=1 Tax=Streptomyces mirabilis TaxID=68239 RepID=UPI0036DD9513
MTAVDEAGARTWYEFIRERLDEELREKYPTTDSTPAMDEYRDQFHAAQTEHQAFLDAWHRGDQDLARNEWWGLKNIADKWRAHPEFPEPISDGTMPCPVPAPETGHPCTKTIPQGWTPSEGHGGGHFWQHPKIAELEAAGAHFDYTSLLSGKPTPWHMPKDCTPKCWKWRDR